jgi:hypothetical protein
MPRPSPLTPANTLGFLIKSHYLGDDIPSVATTAGFATWCVQHYANLETTKALLGRTTFGGTFTTPWKDTRRVFALPHPTSQLAISKIINDNLEEISAEIAGAKLSLYDTAVDRENGRVFKGLNFDAVLALEARVVAHSPVVMTADIGNFFHTVYSHSVPWAVLGKQHVKTIKLGSNKDTVQKAAKDTLAAQWASQIDDAMQAGNARETFGIPVGPDTSRIIAELLLAGVQKDPTLTTALNGRDGYRLMDDFFVGFESEASARKCLDALRSALWAFNLYLNDRKTGIVRSADIAQNIWKYEIESFPLPNKDEKAQRQQLQRLVEVTIQHCHAQADSRPAVSFCKRVMDMKIMAVNLGFVLDCLLRIGREFPANIKTVARFAIEYKNALRKQPMQGMLDRWTREVLELHGPRGHDLEVCWTLIIRGVMRLKVDLSMFGDTKSFSPLVLCILGLLQEQYLLTEPWDVWNETSEITGGLASGRHWLPNYEAVRRKWTSDRDILDAIKAEPLLNRLRKADVTFLDDSDLSTDDNEITLPALLGTRSRRIVARGAVRAARAARNDPYG